MKNVILRNNIQTYIFLFDSNNVREFNNATAYIYTGLSSACSLMQVWLKSQNHCLSLLIGAYRHGQGHLSPEKAKLWKYAMLYGKRYDVLYAPR